jgi:hypothetical protein
MPELDAKDRDKLPKSKFAYVDKEGGEHLPIHDESHVRNAMARFNQTDFESATAKESARRKILAAAKRYGIEVDEDSNVAKPASRSRSSVSRRSKPPGSRAKSSSGSKPS